MPPCTGIDLRDQEALTRLLAGLRLEMQADRVLLDGEDVSDLIRSHEVTEASKPIADSPVVRARLAQLQRELAHGRDIVCEGRDQGTLVFPTAECKFFLVADPVERAHRRQRQMLARGEAVDMDEVLRAQEDRDRRDAARALAPMVPAEDAIHLDSTRLTVEEVVDQMERRVRTCQLM